MHEVLQVVSGGGRQGMVDCGPWIVDNFSIVVFGLLCGNKA